MGRISLMACALCASFVDRIISWKSSSLCGSKNMCSVLMSPMPLAPISSAFSMSSGRSALARTVNWGSFSTCLSSLMRSWLISASTMSSVPLYMRPDCPSMEMVSPSLNV